MQVIVNIGYMQYAGELTMAEVDTINAAFQKLGEVESIKVRDSERNEGYRYEEGYSSFKKPQVKFTIGGSKIQPRAFWNSIRFAEPKDEVTEL